LSWFAGSKAELADALVMVDEAGDDPDMLEMAQAEADLLKEQLPDAQAALQLLLLPKDKDDSRNAILEVRAGTGGDEAGAFCLKSIFDVSALCRKTWLEI
jgi:peptide chain release factor 1